MVSLRPRGNHPWGERHMPRNQGYSGPLWTDREGNEYWCECEISDRYLVNIIRYLIGVIDAQDEYGDIDSEVNLEIMTEIAVARGLTY